MKNIQFWLADLISFLAHPDEGKPTLKKKSIAKFIEIKEILVFVTFG